MFKASKTDDLHAYTSSPTIRQLWSSLQALMHMHQLLIFPNVDYRLQMNS